MDKLVIKDYTSDNTQPCCICNEKIDAMVDPKTGKEIWTEGHNAEPVADGRCCSDCNNNIIVPFRMMKLISSKLQDIGDLSTEAAEDYDTATLTEIEVRDGTQKLKDANAKLKKALKLAEHCRGLLGGVGRKLNNEED